MLLRRTDFALRSEHIQGLNDARTSLFRLDDIVDIAALRSLVRSSKLGDIVRSLLLLVRILAEDDVRSARRAHNRDLGGRPSDDLIRADFAGAHGDVGSAVGLAKDDRDLGNRRLGIRIEHLRAVADNALVLLIRARQEARDVDEVQQRNVERIAEADEARALVGSVDVEAARHDVRLVRDDADRAATAAALSGFILVAAPAGAGAAAWGSASRIAAAISDSATATRYTRFMIILR